MKKRILTLSIFYRIALLSPTLLAAEPATEKTAEHWASFIGHKSRDAQLTAVTELAKLGHPSVTLYLRADDPTVFTIAAQTVINSEKLAPHWPQVARTLLTAPSRERSVLSPCLLANIRLGTPDCGERLLQFSVHPDLGPELRKLALESIVDFLRAPAESGVSRE